MEDNPAPTGRTLINVKTFKDNFGITWPSETYLCYEVEVREGDAWAPVEELQGFLRNEVLCHAELCFLDRVRSWRLDEGKQYRLTCYISWSPCHKCAQRLVEFLGENRHVSLRIFAARIYKKSDGYKNIYTKPYTYEDGLRKLRDAGAQLAIMTRDELQHCWDTFVGNRGQPFEPWPNLEEHIQTESQELESILGFTLRLERLALVAHEGVPAVLELYGNREGKGRVSLLAQPRRSLHCPRPCPAVTAMGESGMGTRGLSCGGSVSCARTLLRTLMDATTFKDNFSHRRARRTYLCYEVEVREGDTWAPVEGLQGFLRNQVYRHAELCFLDRVRFWNLEEGRQYRLTCYISWSPCPDCAQELVEFLGNNNHMRLRIFAARIYTIVGGHEDGLRQLRDAGAQLPIMTMEELQHCWDTFVDNQGEPFEPWPNLVEHIGTASQELENILRNQGN
ncbi:DNA dC-_dU-editing enzyme APOBEC-3G-like [Myotis yumanensis]|uniref:DNA dC->dU-editing enzyme APOBEC-3G-like n=1 Tax=Myotis yumanensis TaxID=159337 RepID=UPI0038D06331